MWYVYFLKLSNTNVYVGSTCNLRRRVRQHHAGEVLSTRLSQPATLVSYVAVPTRIQARRLERYFKSGSGKAFAQKRFLTES